MERTSIITALYIGDANDYFLVALGGGYPYPEELNAHFTKIPLAQEKSDLRETIEDTDQGQLKDIAVRANLYRDATEHLIYENKGVMAVIETANGEKHFFGTKDNPLTYAYTRDSGATISDTRDTTILMGMKVPV
jgi:glycerate kinase